jgi:hypothetical protein
MDGERYRGAYGDKRIEARERHWLLAKGWTTDKTNRHQSDNDLAQ